MSIKIHFLFSDLNKFQKIVGAVSDEQGKVSPRYKDNRTVMSRQMGLPYNADYCWTMMRDNISSEHIMQVKKNKICP